VYGSSEHCVQNCGRKCLRKRTRRRWEVEIKGVGCEGMDRISVQKKVRSGGPGLVNAVTNFY